MSRSAPIDDKAPLRLASWPGLGARHNPFVGQFLSGLQAAGCAVESCDTVEAAAAARPDVLLLHWAERVFAEAPNRWKALAKIRRLLAAAGRRGPKVVWLVHNLAPHDMRRFQRLVWAPYIGALARRADGFLTLSSGTVDTVRRALPGLAAKPGRGLWHPAYTDAALSRVERAAARSALGFSPQHRVLGYCGQIRAYKGVEELLARFLETPGQALRLLIAGRPSTPGLAACLRDRAAPDPRVVLRLEDLPAAEFRAATGACDLVVAPLKDYLHSGSIVYALSAGRPVLTPATPFSQSYHALLGADWLRLYDGGLTPALLAAVEPTPEAGPDLAALAPAAVGAEAMEFFRTLLADNRV